MVLEEYYRVAEHYAAGALCSLSTNLMHNSSILPIQKRVACELCFDQKPKAYT